MTRRLARPRHNIVVVVEHTALVGLALLLPAMRGEMSGRL